ncbi:MAG: D-arabinono-1,4-lactone oxidase [Actinomycetota bacterium]
MGYPHFAVAAAKTSANAAVYLATGRRRLLLEGRHQRGRYRNWSGDRRHRANWFQPRTEVEIARVVAGASQVRLVGSGHSFNDGLATAGATMSLDRLSGIISIDHQTRQATVWAGTRLRDLTPKLRAEGLAIRSLASHDAQSVGGILSSDVHGTGRLPAHLSDQVVGLRIIDGTGTIHDVERGDELFAAAIGGIGAVGIITRVTVQCVEAFRLQQRTRVEPTAWAVANLDRLLAEHDHVSFYAYPFTDLLHVHTWDRTDEPASTLGRRREAINEAKAAVGAAVVGDASAHWGLLPRAAGVAMRLQTGSSLVLESHEAFSRSQYHLHQELEVAVPRDRVWVDLEATMARYRQRYERQRLPFLLTEVRFSPAGHDHTLLGAGVGRDTAWLCLCCNQSGAVDAYFGDVEDWVRETDARIHLGKWCETIDAIDLARMHGERFKQFQAVREFTDPQGKLSNHFADRVLGPVGTC